METTRFQKLIRIHALHIECLTLELIEALSQETGIERGSNIYTDLYRVTCSAQFVSVDWKKLTADLTRYAEVETRPHIETIVEHAHLVADRAVLHPLLYKSTSASTLKLLGHYRPPGPTPREMIPVLTDMYQLLKQADQALFRGRACLAQFERDALRESEEIDLAALRELLDEADTCYVGYRRGIEQASVQHQHLWEPSQRAHVLPLRQREASSKAQRTFHEIGA